MLKNFLLKKIVIVIWWIGLSFSFIFQIDSWPFSHFPMFTTVEEAQYRGAQIICGMEVKEEIHFTKRLHRYFLDLYLSGDKEYLTKYLALKVCPLGPECQIQLVEKTDRAIFETLESTHVCH